MANLETDLARFIPMILSGNNLDLRSDENDFLAREGSLSVHWDPIRSPRATHHTSGHRRDLPGSHAG